MNGNLYCEILNRVHDILKDRSRVILLHDNARKNHRDVIKCWENEQSIERLNRQAKYNKSH